MALEVKLRKKDGKFRFWTTISDSWLTDWLDRDEAVKFLQQRVKERAKMECEDIAAVFPDGYWGTDARMIVDDERRKKYNALLDRRIRSWPPHH